MLAIFNPMEERQHAAPTTCNSELSVGHDYTIDNEAFLGEGSFSCVLLFFMFEVEGVVMPSLGLFFEGRKSAQTKRWP